MVQQLTCMLQGSEKQAAKRRQAKAALQYTWKGARY